MAPTSGGRLRSRPLAPPLQVVLVEPEIPQNTGNIARMCAATLSPLHLVGPLGFRIDEKAVRRAGLDYWHLVQVHRHVSIEHFRHASPASRLVFFSAKAHRSYLQVQYQAGDALVFGRESVGLPEELVDAHQEDVYGIPTLGAVRSLNLANAVGIVLYEALRQLGALDETFVG
ncbi:MAG: tRNA (cytidine(34)-2'-O)-methyltransferase [Deltaproteobacteria bacterium]|nr:tRNA (cytidine(34)-2'-O)-methyltransferase [Deltaproteobacteria bacterium]